MQLKLAVYCILYSVIVILTMPYCNVCGLGQDEEIIFNEKMNPRLWGELRWGVKLRRMIVFLFSIELVGKADFPVITHLNTGRAGQTI